MNKLSLFDRKFLANCHIRAERPRHNDQEFLRTCGIAPIVDLEFEEERMKLAQRIAKHQAPMQLDSTCRALLAMGLPLTRENYLRLQFMGNPPIDLVLDGELEAELPDGIRIDDEDEDA